MDPHPSVIVPFRDNKQFTVLVCSEVSQGGTIPISTESVSEEMANYLQPKFTF